MPATLKRAVGPTTSAEHQFADLLRRADQLRHDLTAFTDRPDHHAVVAGLFDPSSYHDGRDLYADEVVDAIRSLAFVLRAVRLTLSADFGSGRWFDETECRD